VVDWDMMILLECILQPTLTLSGWISILFLDKFIRALSFDAILDEI
jgi:hypothetical protein